MKEALHTEWNETEDQGGRKTQLPTSIDDEQTQGHGDTSLPRLNVQNQTPVLQ